MSRSRTELRLSGLGPDTPFRIETGTLELEAARSRGLKVTFDPGEPGLFEARLNLSFGRPDGRDIDVVLRGEGVLSPRDAGIEVPAPPDQVVREYRQQQIAKLLDEARAAALHDPGAPDGGAEPADPDSPEAVNEGGDPAGRGLPVSGAGGRGGSNPAATIPPAYVIAAFGSVQDPSQDLNNIPASIPEGETTPDLPPAEEPDGGKDSGSTDDGSGAEGDAAGDVEKDGAGDGDVDSKANKSKGQAPRFIIAPNSSVLVWSSKGAVPMQTLTGTLEDDGVSLSLHGRMRFPELSMAFGQTVGLQQWGNIKGKLSADGSLQMDMVLRMEDPNQFAVVDLPISLTTGQAVGFSAEGRIMVAEGIPRNPTTGDVKLVGIVNIPLGMGSSLDKAPIYLEILGRLTL